jgi:thymidylate kinase
MTGKIILIEGSEATGKSTIARELTIDNVGINFHNPAGLSKTTKDLYDYMKTNANTVPSDSMLLLMLAAHIININKMNALKAAGEFVVCDRSILSSFAYNSDHSVDEFNHLLTMVRVPPLNYDKVFVLSSSKETIIKRLYSRKNNDPLDAVFLEKIDTILDRYKEAKAFYPKCIGVNTDTKDIEGVLKYVKARL